MNYQAYHNSQYSNDCIAPGARWKRFLLARASASRREAACLGSILARKWRALNV